MPSGALWGRHLMHFPGEGGTRVPLLCALGSPSQMALIPAPMVAIHHWHQGWWGPDLGSGASGPNVSRW